MFLVRPSRFADSAHNHPVDDGQGIARELLLRSFRWTGGHADFTGVFRDPEALATLGPALAAPFAGAGASVVVAPEAGGFVLGALVARELGVGLVLARKPGSVHPDAERLMATEPDWRGRLVEFGIARDAVRPGDRAVLVDDWIETGSQARAVASLVQRLGGAVIGTSVLVDDTTEAVRSELRVTALLSSTELRESGPSTS